MSKRLTVISTSKRKNRNEVSSSRGIIHNSFTASLSGNILKGEPSTKRIRDIITRVNNSIRESEINA